MQQYFKELLNVRESAQEGPWSDPLKVGAPAASIRDAGMESQLCVWGPINVNGKNHRQLRCFQVTYFPDQSVVERAPAYRSA